jgi:hypothetical protein
MAPKCHPQVFVVRYEVSRPEQLRRPSTALGEEFDDAVRAQEWPYDPADDPAFFCARRLRREGGQLSWGICRPDVRSRLRPGDTVVFLGNEDEGSQTSYRFAGFATVKEMIGQDQIWEDDRYAVYRQYLNLLVEAAGDGVYRHRETHPGDPHPNWLWRLVGRSGYSWREVDFKPWEDLLCKKTIRLGVDRTESGQPIRLPATTSCSTAPPTRPSWSPTHRSSPCTSPAWESPKPEAPTPFPEK